MTAPNTRSVLRRIGESGFQIADPAQEIRGRDVLDATDQKLGTVSDLYVDENEKRVRFIEVASGGFLGIGQEKVLVPVDAVRATDTEAVRLGPAREQVSTSPKYDPALVDEDFVSRTYTHYGYVPFWDRGYVYPELWYL